MMVAWIFTSILVGVPLLLTALFNLEGGKNYDETAL